MSPTQEHLGALKVSYPARPTYQSLFLPTPTNTMHLYQSRVMVFCIVSCEEFKRASSTVNRLSVIALPFTNHPRYLCSAILSTPPIYSITLPVAICTGRVIMQEGQWDYSGRVILTKTIFVDVERRISKRRSPISRTCPWDGILG